MPFIKPHVVLSLILTAFPLFAQSRPGPSQQLAQAGTAAAPLQLSPAAAYREAMRPVEITRATVANWSDIEQSSLSVAIKQAAVACAARPATDYTGAALVDLSRLCALGFTWPAATAAANRYIHEEALPKPRLAEAYALLINAELQLKDEHSTLTDALAMLTAVPYTSVVADSTTQAISYMHLLYTLDAVTLATKRQPLVLSALHSASPEVIPTPDTPPSTADLYKQALVLAELQQLQADPAAAQKTVTALESAVSSALTNDDLVAINRLRDRYALLGKPLASITPLEHFSVGYSS